MIYYSKTTKGFYHDELHGKNMPLDAIKITKELYDNLFIEQSKGKRIVPDENGYPIAIVPPVASLTWEQIRAKRDSLLKDSDWVVLSDAAPKPSKEAWLTYRQALRDITSTFKAPEEVVWPQKP